MVFSSVQFLFVFLPLVIILYFLTPFVLRNLLLLAASLFFYYKGSGEYFFLLIVSILIDYICGWIQISSKRKTIKKGALLTSLTLNLSLLGYFKYFNFFVDNINSLFISGGLSPFSHLNIILPVGISFYTFQTISYQIDLYRGVIKHEKNLIDFSLFVALFPQLVAGPIVRYRDISREIKSRFVTIPEVFNGISRFILGLSKKVLLADPLGHFSDYIFSLPENTLTFSSAWLGVSVFALQVYFDFSAYSDMAIGLGRVFGFKFPENFNYPFISRSLGEFWQRWHITLMKFLRDYLLTFLRGLRGGKNRKHLNIFIIFAICGFWHGASWTFIMWGVFHGTFLILERTLLLKYIQKLPVVIQYCYPFLIFAFSAAFFRARDMNQSIAFLKSLTGFGESISTDSRFPVYFTNELIATFLIALIASTPYPRMLFQRISLKTQNPVLRFVSILTLGTILFVFSVGAVIESQKNPFIYFRF